MASGETCCPEGHRDGGDEVCVPDGTCSPGYFESESGKCELADISPTSCGAAKIDCTALPGVAAADCVSGSCQVLTCEAGYHLNEAECELDSPTSCGTAKIDCTALPGVAAADCVSGSCQVLTCEAGYHLNEAGECELDVACSPPQPWVPDGGYLQDGWDWQKTGPLWPEAQTPAMGDGDLAPALVERDGTLHLFFARKTGIQHTIWHSTSEDGMTWTTPQQTTGLGDGDVISYPSVVLVDTRFRMWFSSGGISLAESLDGKDWTSVSATTLGAGEPGAFDSLSVLYPSVLAEEGSYRLWYTGFNGQTYAIGHARSTDGESFTREPATPVLEVGTAESWDNRAVAQPRVIRAGGRYLLWYGAYDTSRTDPGPYRIASAESTDGIEWTRNGVAIELSATGDDAYSTRDPAVVRWDSGYLMVYSGYGTDLRYRLMAATSEACP